MHIIFNFFKFQHLYSRPGPYLSTFNINNTFTLPTTCVITFDYTHYINFKFLLLT